MLNQDQFSPGPKGDLQKRQMSRLRQEGYWGPGPDLSTDTEGPGEVATNVRNVARSMAEPEAREHDPNNLRNAVRDLGFRVAQ